MPLVFHPDFMSSAFLSLGVSVDPHPDLTSPVIFGLGWLYLILFIMNAFWTYHSAKEGGHIRMPAAFGGQEVPTSGFWALFTGLMLMASMAHFTGYRNPETFVIRMPEFIKNGVDFFADPKWYFGLSVVLFGLMIWLRKWWTKPGVAWFLLNFSLLFLALSMSDYDFRQIVGKPDNVPIVGMLFIVGYFTWLYFRKSVINDERIQRGEPVKESLDNDKVLVWPDLVYTELICMVALTAFLIFWGIALQAPLEEPANAAKTPNPSKAPWYFLGLQEMLVYFDPWLAGVVLPSLMVVGLMAIPYIDFNQKGNGYYTFNERKFAVGTFMFGFLPLWVAMIVLGTFLRGPNWNFFGIYEYWDVHKLEVLNNVNLSEYVWMDFLGQAVPRPSADATAMEKLGVILMREFAGFILVFIYLGVLPGLMAVLWRESFYNRMGFLRFMVFVNLILFMASLPLKMLLRWAFNLKYIIAIPEWFFNI